LLLIELDDYKNKLIMLENEEQTLIQKQMIQNDFGKLRITENSFEVIKPTEN
jgi:hypothetical protein